MTIPKSRLRSIIIFLVILALFVTTWLALKGKTDDLFASLSSDACANLSQDLCRESENCRAILKSSSSCTGSGGTACLAEYTMGFDHCEAIDDEELASYAAFNELCTATGGVPAFTDRDSKYPTCSCGSANREEFFTSGSRKFESQQGLGCTNAKEICNEIYDGTWTSSKISASTIVPNATKKSCQTLIMGNFDPIKVWDEGAYQCTSYTYEPRFPECTRNDNGLVVSRAGGF